MSARARLFVAVDVPEGVRRAAARWRDEHAPDGLRPIAAESLHVTLCFLGWREEGEAGALGAAVAEQAEPVPRLALGPALWLPPRRPRVLALELDDPDGGLVALQARVSEVLARDWGYEPERRPYRPHLTVARARKDARLRRAELPQPPAEPFAAEALTLYRSQLRREGARYEGLTRTPL